MIIYNQGSLNNYNILHRTTLSYIVNYKYYNQGALNNYNILHRTTLSYIVNNNYHNQGSLNNYNSVYVKSLSGAINDLYYNKMFFNGISNGGLLYQVDKSLFYNSVCISGALLFSTNFDNFDNTDPFYIKKILLVVMLVNYVCI